MIAPVVLVAVNYYTKEKEVIPLLSPFMLLACMSRTGSDVKEHAQAFVGGPSNLKVCGRHLSIGPSGPK